MKRTLWILLGFAAIAGLAISQKGGRELVGAISGGAVLLPTGAVVKPAGQQIPLDTFPMTAVLTPNKRHLLVLHGGYNQPSVHVLDPATLQTLSKLELPDAWLGLAVHPNSQSIYVSGGSTHSVYELNLTNEGALERGRVFELSAKPDRKGTDFIGDVALTPDGRLILAADLFNDTVRVINPQSGRVIDTFRTGARPYRILPHPDGRSFFVSSWAAAAVMQHDTETGRVMSQTAVGPHATDMVWREKKTSDEEPASRPFKARIFVTAANTNTVKVLAVTENKEVSLIESINAGLDPMSPAGMTPSALALSGDGNSLFVVCSDANAVAVVDLIGAKSRVAGFLPTGWYPTAALMLPKERLMVLNGKGSQSYPNPRGPSPVRSAANVHTGSSSPQYVGRLQRGSASVIDVPSADLTLLTEEVRRNTPYNDSKLSRAHNDDANLVIPQAINRQSAIEHVIYIIKENRTYDQILGDLGKGNGDPSLTIFGETVTPNHHKLARDFVLLDNFYVNADVSADGHNWSIAAIAPDYTQRMWPNSYAKRRPTYDYEGTERANTTPAGYIWTNALSAQLTVRNYGYFVDLHPLKQAANTGQHIARVREPGLATRTHMQYRGYDLDYMDIDRAKVFIADLQRQESQKQFPRFTILRLGNDHTSGAAAGKPTPVAMVADNDYALGMIVDALSHSMFWPKMAIFVLEDDAQNGADHVDSHRSPAYVISPYSKRGAVDSSFYNTTSMLRTMELMLGLRPMTMHDAGARPMLGAFQQVPNLKPYEAEKPRVSLEERNPGGTPLARRSARFDFTEADEIDDDEMNQILWLAVRGTTPPPPTRSIFGR
ncbi:MAG: hypothetical protein FJW30_04305 [Acidobacteria bacterium]|nr:hypothetical protein [Acidobacteriota bacterium]